MRKFSRAGAAGLILAVAVSASAFAFPSARPAPAGPVTARPATARVSPMQPGGPVRHFGAGMNAAMNAITVTSTNWAGYAASGKGRRFRFVRAAFFVPYIDCRATPDSFSSHWAGLDGFTSPTVEQTGILAACDGTKAVYQAWYEMFPRLPVYPDIKIGPGQSIVVSVFRDARTRKFTIRLTDTTNGHHFTRIVSCPSRLRCLRASAEVISEAPASGSTILPLSDFRAENFGGVRVTDRAGHHAGLRSARWNTFKITNVSRGRSRVMDRPTSLFRGASFGNYWIRPG